MPSYKVPNKPRMHFCATSLLPEFNTSGVRFKKLLVHTFTKQL